MALADEIPPNAGAARDQWILQALQDGRGQYRFATLSLSDDAGNTLDVMVMADALRIDDVRVNVSAWLQAQICDLLSCLPLTGLLADQVWEQSQIRLPPAIRQITSSSSAMVQMSAKIDASLADAGYEPGGDQLIAGPWKWWLLAKAISAQKAMNYGMPFADPKRTKPNMGKGAGTYQGITGYQPVTNALGFSVIQPAATAHDPAHVDYSQDCQLVLRTCRLNGEEADLGDILMSADYAHLASAEGPLPFVRQPGGGGPLPPIDTPTGTSTDGGGGGDSDGGSAGMSGAAKAGAVAGGLLLALGIGKALLG